MSEKRTGPNLGLRFSSRPRSSLRLERQNGLRKVWGDATLSDVDVDLDKEVSYAIRISIRVMHELLRRHESLFPEKLSPIFEAGSEEDSPR